MGRIRRGGYIFEWWSGDHPPRHIHVSDAGGKLLGRVRVEDQQSLDDWQPSRRVVQIIQQLIAEERL